MKRPPAARRRQRGGALLVIAALLLLGIAWGAISAMRNAAPPGQAEREVKTAAALQAAKQALLGYMAQLAARSTTAVPGMLPCPEALASIGTAAEGDEDPGCSTTVGRLPWRTLGIDALYDGDAEPLWYVLSPNFRSAPLNFDSAGQLAYNGAANAAVALIIAPGAPFNAGCTPVDQAGANRNQPPLNPANFFECGNATGAYAHLGLSASSNDRVIAITAAEWIAALTPIVADRMQREVAPAIRNWDAYEQAQTGKSWGTTHGQAYLPFASDWEDPSGSGSFVFCGNQPTVGVPSRGLMPIDPACYDNPWTVPVGGVTMGGLLNVVVGNPALCWDTATGYIRCQFRRVLGLGSATASVTLQAANVGRAFRGTLQASDITMTHSGTKTISSASIANSTSDATITINLTWPANLLILAINQVVTADIPHLQAARIHTDPRVTWFVNNNWHRYTWYAVSPDATANNSAWADRCDAPGDPGCLWVNNLAAAHGNTNDKQLVLVLSGLPLGTQSTPSADLTQYFEAQNASLGVVYQVGTTSTTFNDRVAMCPFKHVDHSNNDVVLCN